MGGGVEERARELGAGAVVGAGRLAAFQAVARPLARTQRILRRRSLSRSSGHVLMSPDWRVSRSQQAPSLAGSPGHAWHSRALAGHWPVARSCSCAGAKPGDFQGWTGAAPAESRQFPPLSPPHRGAPCAPKRHEVGPRLEARARQGSYQHQSGATVSLALPSAGSPSPQASWGQHPAGPGDTSQDKMNNYRYFIFICLSHPGHNL